MKETRKRTIRKRIRQSLSSSKMKTTTTTTKKKEKKKKIRKCKIWKKGNYFFILIRGK